MKKWNIRQKENKRRGKNRNKHRLKTTERKKDRQKNRPHPSYTFWHVFKRFYIWMARIKSRAFSRLELKPQFPTSDPWLQDITWGFRSPCILRDVEMRVRYILLAAWIFVVHCGWRDVCGCCKSCLSDGRGLEVGEILGSILGAY